ncbi:MAG: hypothetical protein WC307_07280, partial [Candidatus Nanoarchaeia archaeon]
MNKINKFKSKFSITSVHEEYNIRVIVDIFDDLPKYAKVFSKKAIEFMDSIKGNAFNLIIFS